MLDAIFVLVDSAQKFDTMPNIDDTPLIDDGMKNNEDESSDERARSSSNEMSADSLEEEGNTAKLCTQLKNVKLGYSKVFATYKQSYLRALKSP